MYSKYVKRFFDIILSLLFLAGTFPILIVVALLIWLNDRGTLFYIPIRVGQNKLKFKFYKFRSMIMNAEVKSESDNPKLYRQLRSGGNKIKNDPRITKIGKFIRKYSIDEFPQVFNVLKGDMSFIGPRALMPDEFNEYLNRDPKNKKLLDVLVSVKPGITGYWQVSGRSDIDFDTRMEMDNYYADNLSLKFDLWILLKTPMVVIKGEGSY